MFGRVVAEAACAQTEQIVDVGEIIMLEVGIFSIDVRQSAHLAGSALVSVVPLRDRSETVGME